MLKSNNIKKGFTIIEVIIVLVVAAIIMLMVFLVVPQLQRNQRDARRQAYARQLLSAVSQWYSNNASTPDYTALTGIAGTFTDPSTGALAGTDYTIAGYNSGTITPNLGKIWVFTGYTKCGSDKKQTSGSGATVVIGTEPGGTGLFCVSDGS